MPQGLPKKNIQRLWEWQKYVKKETQRLQKASEFDSKSEIVKPPLPRGPEIKKKRTAENRQTQFDEPIVKTKEKEISTRELEDIDETSDFEQDLEMLMSDSDIEIDDTLKPWIEPEVKSEPVKTAKPKPSKPRVEKIQQAKKTAQQKTSSLELFNQELEKERRKKRSPRKTREHLIENLLDPVISLDEAAVILNVCKTTVRRYTNGGKLECIRTPGNQRRFRLSNVLEFLEEKEGKKVSKGLD